MELTFAADAEIDLAEVKGYYDEISETITANFFKEFFLTLKYIGQSPQLFQVRYRSILISPLYRFPCGVHYREKDGLVVIYRVLHTKRYFKS